MPLQEGQSIAHYRVESKIGEGGMGEVYRARDTRLNRAVALKVLPDAFAADADRMARFAREAQLLASLNHPNIGAIYGLEEDGPTRCLVLELIEGETLAERLTRGPLPLEEALDAARQIAEALEAAHDRGVIHRDLKPGNIKVSADGKVKVLDFGLAKALEGEAGAADSSMSPTLTTPATHHGMILGTAAYMSPEQAKGRPADRRADIWSFGVVLHEMLSGRRMFSAETVSETLAAVLMKPPALDDLPEGTPAVIRRLLERCLEREPRERLQAIGEARIAIDRHAAEPQAEQFAAAATPSTPPVSRRRRLRAIGTVAFLIAAAAVAGYLASGMLRERPVLSASILPPPGTQFHVPSSDPGAPVLAPDGRSIVFSARDEEEVVRLYVRRLDAPEAYLLSGTERGQYPFWSPDSRYIGFFVKGVGLRKILATGGPPVTLCEALDGKGGAWSRAGVILFPRDSTSPISRVSEAGGEATEITALDAQRGEASHRHPFFLPDGNHFLYFVRKMADDTGGDAVFLGSLDGMEGRKLVDSGAGAIYASGHLLFLREPTLMAQPFDTGSLELTGEAVPIAEKVGIIRGASKGAFSASENGNLTYLAGLEETTRHLEWIGEGGVMQGRLGDEAFYTEVALSPDGTMAAVVIRDPAAALTKDIWIYDIARDLRTRFTFEPGDEANPAWSPDGQAIYYTQEHQGRREVYRKMVGGSEPAELVLAPKNDAHAQGVSRDGRFLTLDVRTAETGWDVWVLPLDGKGEEFPLLDGKAVEVDGMISPDGRFLAYVSLESGQTEVFVTSFPGRGRKWQISTKRGDNPLWSSDGKTLYYMESSGMIQAVEIETDGSSLRAGAPRPLFETEPSPIDYRYSAAPDGRFLIIASDDAAQSTSALTLVLNWPARLPH